MKFFLKLPPALFLVAFLLLAWYNRFAADDFEFLLRYRDLGFGESVRYFYDNWNTRFCAVGLMNFFFLVIQATGTLFWYHLVSILMLWFTASNLVRQITGDKVNPFIMGAYATVAIYYCSFSISDVFFWVNTSTMYLWSIIAFLGGLSLIFMAHRKLWHYFLLVICGAYLGGSCEPFALVVFLAGIAIMVTGKVRNHLHRSGLTGLMVFLVFISFSFLISYLGNGHSIRSGFLPETSVADKLWIYTKALVKMFGIRLPGILLPAVLFSFPWVLAGVNNVIVIPVKHIKTALIVFVALTMVSLFPIVWVMSEMGPERAWNQVTVYFVMLMALLGIYAGNMLRHRFSEQRMRVIYLILASLFVIASGTLSVIKARDYSRSYDNRIAYLLELKRESNHATISLPPLPDSGVLHSAEISTDTLHFTNMQLKNWLGLDYNITLSELSVTY